MTKAGLIIGVLGFLAGCQQLTGGSNVDPTSEEEKTFYTIGIDIAKTLETFNPSPGELDMVHAGIDDYLKQRKLKVDFDAMSPKIQEMKTVRGRIVADKQRDKGKNALESASKEPGARRLAPGMVIRTLRPGIGASPKPADKVKVTYEARLLDGKLFDTSAKGNGPVDLTVQETVPCFINGLTQMKVGESARLTCAAEMIAIGGHAPSGVPDGAAAVYDVELLEVKAAP